MKFKNAPALTEEELREWASVPNVEYPEEMSQDWDLILAYMRHRGQSISFNPEQFNIKMPKQTIKCMNTLSWFLAMALCIVVATETR